VSGFSEYHQHLSTEIVSLQKRANQLTLTTSAADRLLASLRVEAEAARSVQDIIGLQRVVRKIQIAERRRRLVVNELKTMLELIAARRTR
jgi:hypothetical protein